MSGEPTADRFIGLPIPEVRLMGYDGVWHDLRSLASGAAVFYIYPATGVMGRDPAPDWDDHPGAAGCTVQSLGFRNRYDEFQGIGVGVAGISSQASDEQRRFALSNRIPFALLSDPPFELAAALALPTFYAGELRFYQRVVLIVSRGTVVYAFCPWSAPAESADRALEWIRACGRAL